MNDIAADNEQDVKKCVKKGKLRWLALSNKDVASQEMELGITIGTRGFYN